MSTQAGTVKKLDAHIWERETDEHYVEPEWCSRRFFEEEPCSGGVWDPACGFGRIVDAAKAACSWEGAVASDLVDRGYPDMWRRSYDFLNSFEVTQIENIVTNPPFNIADKFALRALQIARNKVAIIFPTARLNAARWIKGTPLRRVWLMTPRPSMPPGHVITRGEKPGGGKMDFCWLVWERDYKGEAEIRWLRRDGNGERSGA